MVAHKSFWIALLSLGTVAVGKRITFSDRGNPARFIRGAFMDMNQPEFQGSQQQKSSTQEENLEQISVEFVQTRLEGMLVELEAYNQEVTTAMIGEAQNINSGKAAVQICRFARSRLIVLKTLKHLQTVMVQLATLSVQEMESNNSPNAQLLQTIESSMLELSSDFAQMQVDLREFDTSQHGSAAMNHFSQALKYFTEMDLVVNQNTS